MLVNVFAANGVGLPTSEVTLAEIAKSVGYKTALVGKSHDITMVLHVITNHVHIVGAELFPSEFF
jgi:arylsulfatase A-like enzyme